MNLPATVFCVSFKSLLCAVFGVMALTTAIAAPPESLPPSPPSLEEKASSPKVAVPWAKEGELVYTASQGSTHITLGEARFSWQHDEQAYKMTLALKTTGLIDAIYRLTYAQTSEGSVTPEGFVPALFRVTQKGREDETATFDWREEKVTILRKGKKTDYPIEKGVQDVLSVWHIAAIEGVEAFEGERSVVTNRRVYQVNIKFMGMEDLTLPIGKVATRHLVIKGKSPSGFGLDLWIAPEFSYLPVKIMMTGARGGAITLQLKTAKK